MISFFRSIKVNLKKTVYLLSMIIIYYTYVLLDKHQIDKSENWSLKSNITQKDIDAITNLGKWISTFEALFCALFLVAFIVIHILAKRSTKVLTRFLLMNVALFIVITVINYSIVQITSIPIGNLMQPLMIPLFLMIVFFVYVLFLRLKK